jgi:23S rRNA (uracil1939-C5)-methyltransferase
MQENSIEIESLDMEARGVGRAATKDGAPGKVIFVEGALPGERVTYSSFRRKARWEAATLTEIHTESSLRVKPKCAYFGTCGGCAMQHLEPTAQVAVKQRVLEDNLHRLGKVSADIILPPIHGPTWEYRYRARISVRNVPKKGGILVGFHERKSAFVADMKTCEILPGEVSRLLVPLRELIASLSIINHLPQIELAVGESGGRRLIVLVLRIMAPMQAEDETKLKAFADRHCVEWWLQPKGPDTVYPFYPATSELAYTLPEFGIRIPFKPTDFTQVNHQINRVLVSRAIRLLGVQPQDRIGDMFCGLGNFTLALATRAAEVIGIEGSPALVERAESNASENGLQHKTSFQCRNLFELSTDDFVALGRFDRLLIDPPRDGAIAMCEAIAGLEGELRQWKPKRIVYVSCNPATLARDAGLLVQKAGYQLSKAGIVNMFPHTAHVESIAVLDLAEH